MPMSNGTYYAPTWNNNAPPAIDATELQAISDTAAIVPTLVRPNLLDNWYFVGGGSQSGDGIFPINQRGNTSYTGTNSISIDKWMVTNGTSLAVNSGCVTLATTSTSNGGRSMRFAIENPKQLDGKTITLSVLFGSVSTDAVYCQIFSANSEYAASSGLFTLPSNATSNGLYTITGKVENIDWSSYPYLTAFIGFWNYESGVGVGATAEVKAVKLEVGDTQTLAHYDTVNSVWVLNEVPKYEEQLFRCQTSLSYASDLYSAQENLVGFQVRPNLLDNAYFVGGGSQLGAGKFPINQRGSATYTPSVGQYTIDRWYKRVYNTSPIALESDGIKMTSGGASFQGIIQSVENGVATLAGKTVTLSVLVLQNNMDTDDARIFLGNANDSSSVGTALILGRFTGAGFFSFTYTIPSTLSNSMLNFGLAFSTSASGKTIKVSAMKLEVGNTQTLAHKENGAWVLNEVPNYEQELARCQRFYYQFDYHATNYAMMFGKATGTTSARLMLPLPVKMRTVPTISSKGQMRIEYNGSYALSSDYSVFSCSDEGICFAVASLSYGSLPGDSYPVFAFFNTETDTTLSADL